MTRFLLHVGELGFEQLVLAHLHRREDGQDRDQPCTGGAVTALFKWSMTHTQLTNLEPSATRVMGQEFNSILVHRILHMVIGTLGIN